MKKYYFLLLALGLFMGAEAQIITIPDANFKAKLLLPNQYGASQYFNPMDGSFNTIPSPIARNSSFQPIIVDANGNNQIEVSEALNVYYLDLSYGSGTPGNMPQNLPISNLTGIEYFTNLRSLNCRGNQLTTLPLNNLSNLTDLDCSYNQLTTLVTTQFSVLRNLYCSNNQLTSLNLTQNPGLYILVCDENQLTSLNVTQNPILYRLEFNNNHIANIDLTHNPALFTLLCDHNQLVSLDVSQNTVVYYFSFEYNQLTSIDLSHNVALGSYSCRGNQLNSLDVSNNPALDYLDCRENHLTSLDVSQNIVLTTLRCSDNQLVNLFIKNGNTLWSNLEFLNNSNLLYVCADENDITMVQNKINQYGYTNCQVNSYCSFTPGGTFYTIQGSNKLDANNNGCDALDLVLPNLKFNITDGTNNGSLISNATGNYSIPVIAGTHTIAPVFENPSYFTAFPSTVNATFPTQVSPFTQNFCVTANGVHPDLEVTLLPMIGARPGFDAIYKLVYRNKGNTTQLGTVNLVFNDAVLDLVVSNPVATSQAVNNLSWNFTNLLPFETREILVTLNVNSPMDTPAVNGGDVLNYTAMVTSVATDDLPNDNTFAFNQTVVNSFDPNDKTCLEGATITPSKVGEYVHYMIRFENNGTANAQNIVVKDMIDMNKFDVSSIVPIKGSHSFVTNITEQNKVEFIFENINLPFDDANNDGYISFKIKTKPTLVDGDTFSNTASIYFDYNFPIVTNTATTTIAALAVQDFEFSNYFSVYPNPVSDVLNITSKGTIEISSVNIYNTLGQLVLVIPNAKDSKTVDVSSLASGNYFIKINSDKGTSNTKFIKK